MAANIEAANTVAAEAIEPEHINSSDGDSGYDERTLSTASVTSTIFEYLEENGRTYHSYKAERNYALPNDEQEKERMDIHYHSLRLALFDNIFFAPIENPMGVLDVGTGTGIWAMDVADKYPAAEVLGVDISPTQPEYVPQNCSFQIMDLNDDWVMTNRFDLVHSRNMNGFSIKDWGDFYRKAFNATVPGGWFENQEFDFNISSDDNTIPENSKTIEWQTLWEKGIKLGGLTGRCYPEQMKQQAEAAGFTDVHILGFKMPVGPWPKNKTLKQSGLLTLVGLLEGIQGLSLRVFTALGWEREEVEVFLAEVRNEMKNKKIHTYFPIWVVYGQKPKLPTERVDP